MGMKDFIENCKDMATSDSEFDNPFSEKKEEKEEEKEKKE